MNKRFHRITLIWEGLYWFLTLLFISAMINIAWIVIRSFFDSRFNIGSYWPYLILTAVFSLVAEWFFKSNLDVHIVTSPDGLEYHGVGVHLRSSWENIKQISLRRKLAELGIGEEIISLSEPPEILSINWYGKLTFKPNHKSISLSRFGHWRYTSLGDEIRKYAPKLLA